MSSIHNPHDILAKRFLTNVPTAVDFLKSHLPAEIKTLCDFTTIEIKPTSYIEEDMRAHMSDILYSLKIDGKPGFIYVLLEAQSTPLKLMPLRYLRYQTSIWKHYAESHPNKGLPVIFPVLFYTGKEPTYPYSLDFIDCFEDPELAKSVFHQPIKLIDLTVMPDSEIKAHGQAALLEIVQKHIYDRDLFNLAYDVIAILQELQKQKQEINRDLYADMLKYVVSEGDSQDVKGFFNILIEGSTQHRETVMTIAERLREEGFQNGMHKGSLEGAHQAKLAVAQNLLSQNIDFEIIKKATKLSDLDLAKLVRSH